MLKIITLILLMLVYSDESLSSKDGHLVLSEKASFRLENNIYYLSEVTRMEKKIQLMNCIVGGESLLLRKLSYFEKKKSSNVVEEVIFLKKLENYLIDLKFNVRPELLKKLIGANLIKCGVQFDKILKDTRLLSMLLGEIFYQENFYVENGISNQKSDLKATNKRWNGFVGLIHSKYLHYVYE